MSTQPSNLAVGTLMFTGVIMITIGVFHVLWGFTAVLNNEVFIYVPDSYLYQTDVRAWGWVHLISGLVVALAGFAVYSGAVWARLVGVLVASLSAITNFLSIPYHPIWSILIIALDFLVIWALTIHGRDLEKI